MTKIGLRNAWFQVHKWIGLILAILIIPVSLSGTLLVWDEALDHLINPARYAVTGSQGVDPARYVTAARAALEPGDVVSAVTLPRGDEPAVVTASHADGGRVAGGPPARMMVYLDPPTARVLAVADTGSGLVRLAHNLHANLFVPVVGRQIVGVLGIAMLLSSLTGLWLWWPLVGTLRRGLRWKRHRNTDVNLHYLLGFWISLPLFVLSLTGVWIAFPQVFGNGMGGARGARPMTLADPKLDLDTVIASAQAKLPGDVARVEWPTDRLPLWKVSLGAGKSVMVAEATGVAVPARVGRETLARTMRRMHDGTQMGLLWQILVFLGGLIPAALAVTGTIMWARAQRWRAALKARMAMG